MDRLARTTARIERPLRLGRKPSRARIAAVFALSGILGWVIENAAVGASGPRYSRLFGGLKVPFLPVYGAGGVALSMTSSRLRSKGLSIGKRAAVYAGLSTLTELAACGLDRATGGEQWNYTGETAADELGCVSLPHTAAWTALAFAMEPLS